MKRASEMVGLRVLGIKEGLENGIVQDFMIDPKTKDAEYLILKSTNGYVFRALRVADVMGVGADYVMTASIENAKKMYEAKDILEKIENGFFILGTTALSGTGDVMGKVLDFEFDEMSGKVGNLYLDDETEFGMDKVATLAGRMVFIDPSGDNLARIIAPIQQENAVDKESRDFLIGKTVKAEAVSEDGALRIQAGTVLTDDLLIQAANHDMLLSLTLSV